MSVLNSLAEHIVPRLEPLSTGALVFFKGLEVESDGESEPSGEQVQAIQSLLETSGAEARPKVEVKDLDKSIYFDADEEEDPLTSSPPKVRNLSHQVQPSLTMTKNG